MRTVLDAIETKKLAASAIPWPMQVGLMNNDDQEIRKKARALITAQYADRDEALSKYGQALTLAGDAVKGENIFKTVCSSCHQVNKANGTAFGPDLASIRNRDARFILADIIQPERSIADGFEWWEVSLRSGKKTGGLIASETSSSIRLKDPTGSESIIPRAEIESMIASQRSAMPSGLEQGLSLQQMADLLAYLKK
jgi:putative heme-binding domain-containing protein